MKDCLVPGGVRSTVCSVSAAPPSTAGLAVDVVLWELGPRVVIGVGDAPSEDWMTRALAQREETMRIAADRNAAVAAKVPVVLVRATRLIR